MLPKTRTDQEQEQRVKSMQIIKFFYFWICLCIISDVSHVYNRNLCFQHPKALLTCIRVSYYHFPMCLLVLPPSGMEQAITSLVRGEILMAIKCLRYSKMLLQSIETQLPKLRQCCQRKGKCICLI